MPSPHEIVNARQSVARDRRLAANLARCDEMRKDWGGLHATLTDEFLKDPDLSKRPRMAKVILDVMMHSAKEGVILKGVDMLRKMYGHDEHKIVVEDLGREERMEKWKSELVKMVGSGGDRLLSGDIIDVTPIKRSRRAAVRENGRGHPHHSAAGAAREGCGNTRAAQA
jgi:hypothetical protein